MNHRRSAGLLLSLNLLLVGAPTALAHELPTPTPGVAPLSEQEQYKLALEHYKLDIEQYRIDMNRRELVRKEIVKAFVTAIHAANKKRPKTSDPNLVNNAITDALLLRNQALEAMGADPIEPTKPVKPAVTAIAKKAKASKPSRTPSP